MKKFQFGLHLLAMLGMSLAFSTLGHAQATRTWVSGVGDDVNPCSRTAPCKTFAGAISKTAAGGEIDCLDPGGFGAVTITKSITIDCGGTLGSVLSSGVQGVIINALITDSVTLRNLSINGAGTTVGTNGVAVLAAKHVRLENVFINNYSNACVLVNATNSTRVLADNVAVGGCVNGFIVGTTVGTATLNLNNVKISDSTGDAIRGGANSLVTVRNANISFVGVALNQTAGTSKAIMSNSQVFNSGTGVQGFGGSMAAVFGNTFSLNTLTLNANGGTIYTDGQNAIPFNTSNGTANGGTVTKM